jgi:hypothetical protein
MEMLQNQISPYHDKLTNRMNSIQGFLNRNIFRMYQQAQLERWKSENTSEGEQWAPLTAQYAQRKKKKFAAFPGAGQKIMIATGKLYETTTGRNPKGLRKVATNKSLIIKIDDGYIPYAKFAAEERPIMEFSEATIQDMKDAVVDYIKGLNQ